MFYFKQEIKAAWLAKELNLEYSGDYDVNIKGVSRYSDIGSKILSFIKSTELNKFEGVLISRVNSNGNVIISNNPRLDFMRALLIIKENIGFITDRSKPIVHPTVELGENVILEHGVTIGAGTIIEHNVVIAKGTKVGKNCLIRANASIGSDGFGFERSESGVPVKFIHLGGVSIGNNVEIGSCTCIARGTLSDTVIEENVKIDNLVHIAHNCIIRKGAFIIACAEISGGVDVGKNSWVAPNSSINQKLVIGQSSLVGLAAVVTKNVRDNDIVIGNPARPLKSKS